MPIVTASRSWDLYASIPGWSLCEGPSIEIQRRWSGYVAADGEQYVELDSTSCSAICQGVPTKTGQSYTLRFAFSERPGVPVNGVEVLWEGLSIATIRGSGIGLSAPRWRYYEFTVTAHANPAELRFRDLSACDTYGSFLDDVSIKCLP
jgi:hypothetical protein